ncbi:SEL1-like repeat protein [Paenibacillus oceani]|uniref:SEL1-like repeat protein n=1 Tax=Paenibacillus oceani TaxID=2772510 RepID=A0A927CHA1_9BACL|nr:SEL1-like repeat protein [Paenibacillus oceani]MBD2866603.1 SEL1-like repeat protein [Paenibacillus oceani]
MKAERCHKNDTVFHITSGFRSFAELLNYKGYDYGWGCIWLPFEEEADAVIFEENGLRGLKDKDGSILLQPQFDVFADFGPEGVAAQQDGKWGVLDSSGSVIVPLTYDELFENGLGYYHTAVKGQPGRHIFNEQFAYVGQFPVSALEPVGEGLLLVKPHTNVNYSSLYNKNGTLLASGFDKLNRQTDFPNMLIVRKGKQYGILGIKQETYLLPYGYDAFIDLQAADREGGVSNLVLARKDGKTGVFNGDPDHPSWLFPLDDYEAVCWLFGHVFALRRNGRWGIADSHDHWKSGFEFDYVERRLLEEASAYAVAGPDVYVVSPEGLTRADRMVVREEAEDEYYSRYFETDVLKRLLAYAYSDDPGGAAVDENPMHELYNQAQDAYTRGDVDAMNGLGVCYLDGVGTATDIDQALHWLGQAAERNNPFAHNNLADLYFDGLLVPHDLGKALGHYEQGEALGSPNYIRLGYIHEQRGHAEKAASYYRLAYEDGCEVGAFNMGICCSQEIGVTKNTDSAIQYFQAALERDYPAAHIELARIYRSGNEEADESLAEYHIREAEKAGLDIPEDLLANS